MVHRIELLLNLQCEDEVSVVEVPLFLGDCLPNGRRVRTRNRNKEIDVDSKIYM